MKKHTRISLAVLLLPTILILTACGVGQPHPSFQASFANVAIDEQIEKADIILAGRITNISKTLWNQDSGEYWEEVVEDEISETRYVALPYYTIELAVERPIVNAQKDDTLVVTVIGMSPSEGKHADSELSLQVGSEVVMFIRHSEMAWREGKRPILQLMSSPEKSGFLRGRHGLYETAHLQEEKASLDELIARIAQKRPVVTQP